MKFSSAIDKFMLDCKAGDLSPATIRWYDQRLSKMVAFLRERGIFQVEGVTTDDLRTFVVSLREQEKRWEDHPYRPSSNSGLSPHTIHGYVRMMRTYFRWLADEKIIDTSPAQRVRLPDLPKKSPKAIDPDDRDCLLETAKPDPRDHAIVCFLADTACRVGGLVGLQLKDLEIAEGQATVREKGRGGCKSRTVYFNKRTQDALSRWLDARPETGSDAVFLSKKTGKALTTSGAYQVLERLAERGGVEGRFNPHSFRHGWAKEALKNGASLADVAQVLGHEDETVTMRFYGQWAGPELQERHSKFSPLAD